MLSCAQEKLEVKKRLLERMDQMGNHYVENVKQIDDSKYGKVDQINSRGIFFTQKLPSNASAIPPYHFQGSSSYLII